MLKRKKMSCGAIHGDLPQSKREKTLAGFRDGSLPCMIATNVAARGIDIPTVSHVVNYDIPENPEEYVHRVGRTARMGRTGIARTFITPEDGQFLLEIEKHIGMLLEEEVIEGMQTTTAEKAKKRTIASNRHQRPAPAQAPRRRHPPRPPPPLTAHSQKTLIAGRLPTPGLIFSFLGECCIRYLCYFGGTPGRERPEAKVF